MVTFLALASVSALLVRLLRLHQAGAALHPGAWFAVAWLSAIPSYLALEAVEAVPIRDEDLLRSLLWYVTFAAVLFLALTLAPPRRPRSPSALSVSSIPRALKFFALAGLGGAAINWVALGATLGYDDSIRQQWLTQIPRVTVLSWYGYFLSFPAALISGRAAGLFLLRRESPKWREVALLMTPFLAGFLWSISTGGRQALGLVVFHYLVGVCIALALGRQAGYSVGIRRGFRAFLGLGVIIILLALFIGLTGQARARQQGNQASPFEQFWYLAPIGQFIGYNGLALAAHQAYGTPARRDLSETGPVAIAGLQYFGLRYFTGWRPPAVDDTNPERALAASGLPLASATRNLFYDLEADFGEVGAYIATTILVFISHFLFVATKNLRSGRLLPAAPLAMSLMFWGYSHQFSLLIFNTFFWLVVTCLLWDMFSSFLKARR